MSCRCREARTTRFADAADAIRVMSAAEHTGKLVLDVPRTGHSNVVVPPEQAHVFRTRRRLHHHRRTGWPRALPRREDGRGRVRPDRAHLSLRSRTKRRWRRSSSSGRWAPTSWWSAATSPTPAPPTRLVAAATATGLPLRGVLHAAAVVEDATLDNITDELIDRDWAPKVYGAWNLHQATAGQPLDWFCSFSSAAALVGSPGQGAYAAANSWLDAFTHWRRAHGLPATAIAWARGRGRTRRRSAAES